MSRSLKPGHAYGHFNRIDPSTQVLDVETTVLMEEARFHLRVKPGCAYEVLTADERDLGLCWFIGRIGGADPSKDLLYFSRLSDRRVFRIRFECIDDVCGAFVCSVCGKRRYGTYCRECNLKTTRIIVEDEAQLEGVGK